MLKELLDLVRHRCRICAKSILYTKDPLQHHLKLHGTVEFNDYVKTYLVVEEGEDEHLESTEEDHQIDEEEYLIYNQIDEEEELIYDQTDKEERNYPDFKKPCKCFKFPSPNTPLTPFFLSRF